MTELLLRLLYGAIVISSGFLIGSMGRLAWREFRRVGGHKAVRSTYFWLSANTAAQGLALTGICALRTIDSFRGVELAGSWGIPLVCGFGLLLLCKVGFNWAGTIDLDHGKAIWRSFLFSLVLWAGFVLTWR